MSVGFIVTGHWAYTATKEQTHGLKAAIPLTETFSTNRLWPLAACETWSLVKQLNCLCKKLMVSLLLLVLADRDSVVMEEKSAAAEMLCNVKMGKSHQSTMFQSCLRTTKILQSKNWHFKKASEKVEQKNWRQQKIDAKHPVNSPDRPNELND